MKLDIGSIAFNLNMADGGGTPSWGTALGQNTDYKFTVAGAQELMTSMTYTIVDKNDVFCPLGKGGHSTKYSYEFASLYKKVYVNGILIPNAEFVLLVVKQVEGENHVGRRTLKYSPRITYKEREINQDCINKIIYTLGLNHNSAWFVYSIYTKNQDELHFDAIIANQYNSITFNTTEERKNYMLDLLKKNGIDFTECDNLNTEVIDKDIRKELNETEKFEKYYLDNLHNLKDDIELYDGIRLRKEFQEEYPLEKIKNMTLIEYSLGYTEQATESLSYKLEFGKYKHVGLSIGGGSAAKHGIYKGKDGNYHGRKEVIIDKPEDFWTQLRDQLYAFLCEIGSSNVYPDVDSKYPLIRNIPIVATKLCYLYYPEKFINIGTKGKLSDIIDRFDIDCDSTISSEKSYYVRQYFSKTIPVINNDDPQWLGHALWRYMDNLDKEEDLDTTIIDDIDRIPNGFNKIYYGVPGSGKSFTVAKEFNNVEYQIYRTTFHPEYTNSDFVGQIIPSVKDNKVEYTFHPGSFTLALKYALEHKNEKVCLIIEEINRGNSSAIFGDIFQLLDRDKNGKSKYEIYNGPILDYLSKEGINLDSIYIPSNMWIIGTMNTSDQNVFTLDTAFKRRWKMEYIKNIFADNEESKELKNKLIPAGDKYQNVTWEKFVSKINEHIIDDSSGINAEDKQLGMYFVSIEEINNQKEFAEKILSYIWEDVAKLNTTYWFGTISSYDKLLNDFEKNGLDVFNNLFEEELTINEEYTIKTIGE